MTVGKRGVILLIACMILLVPTVFAIDLTPTYWWTFNNTVVDVIEGATLSGSGYNTTVKAFGEASLQVRGSWDYDLGSDLLLKDEDLSLNIWVYGDSEIEGGDDIYLVDMQADGSTNEIFFVAYDGTGDVEIGGYCNSEGFVRYTMPYDTYVDEWYMATIVYDYSETNLSVYINGDLVFNDTCTELYNDIGQIDFGHLYGSGESNYLVDEARIFKNYALSESQITSLYDENNAEQDLTNGLISYFSMDEDGTDSVSGYNLTGTGSGAIHSTSEYALGGGSYECMNNRGLGNSHAYPPLGTNNPGKDFTYCSWFKPTHVGTGGSTEFVFTNKDSTGSEKEALRLYDDSSTTLKGETRASSRTGYLTSASTFNNESWTLGCVSRNKDGVLQLWVNGTKVEETGVATSDYDTDAGFRLCSNPAASAGWFYGFVDDVGIWNRQLSSVEMETLWNDGSGNSPLTPVVPSSEITINWTSPENNTQYNSNNLIGGDTLYFNYSFITNKQAPVNCSLYQNGVLNQTSTGLSNNTNYNFNITYGIDTEATHYYQILCEDNESSTLEINRTIYVDLVNPLIISNFVNGSSISGYTNLTGQFNFSDSYLYSINITIDNTKIFSVTELGVQNYIYNMSENVSSYGLGLHNLSVTVADGHTKKKIEEYDYSTWNKELKFSFKEKWYQWNQRWVKIYPKNKNRYAKVMTKKLKDRYTFEFEKKPNENKKNYETYIVESDGYIHIANPTPWKGHLILPAESKWIDFETDEGYNVETNRINDNKVEVKVYGVTKDKIKFNSIGDLNIVTNTYDWTASGQLRLRAFEAINQTNPVNDFTISVNGSTNGTTSNGTFDINDLSAGDYLIGITSPGYVGNSQVISFSGVYQEYNFTLQDFNSFNITFYDEITEALLEGVDINVEFIGDDITYNYTTNTSKLYVSNISSDIYTVRYSANGYVTRSYDIEMENESYNQLELYMLNSSLSSSLTVKVYDSTTTALISGAVVYLQKFYPVDNEYVTVGTYVTGSDGSAYFDISDEDEYYKFVVEYPLGTVRLTTDKQYIQTSPINLYINLESVIGDTFFAQGSITYALSFNDDNREFELTWNDPDLVATQYCFYVKEYGFYGSEIVNSSCSSNSGGSVSLKVPDANETYYALFTAFIDGEEVTIATAWKEFLDDELNAGPFGLFMTAVMMIIFAFLSSINFLSLVFFSGGLIFAKLLGLVSIGWGYVFFIFIGGLILAIVMNARKNR